MASESRILNEPTREEIDAMAGPVLVEFGASWCGHCQALTPELAKELREHPDIQHIKIEDGPKRPLGRSFGVKLWPSLFFMRDGQVLKRAARPSLDEVRAGLKLIDRE